MIIPPTKIDASILIAIAEEFITREGTDYGEYEHGLQEKVEQLMPHILKSEVLIVFDEESEAINLVRKEDYTTL